MAFKNKTLKLTSSVFEQNGDIPSKYTCMGEDVNPPLLIAGIPREAKSLVLIVDDPDAPSKVFDHWIVWNIPPDTVSIDENALPSEAIEGMNGFGRYSYGGPCPPSGTHRYFFKLYALDRTLSLPPITGKEELYEAMKNYIIDYTELIGKFTKNENK